MRTSRTPRDTTEHGASLPFRVHVGGAETIWRDAERAESPHHLLVTPVQLHRRNVQRRLREAGLPRSAFDFARLVDVARNVNGAARKVTNAEPETESLDRIDRLALIRRVLRDGSEATRAPLERAVGTPVADHAESIERARVGLEMVTGFHPARLDALNATIGELDGAAGADARDLVDGLLSLQAELETQADATVSETDLLRIASSVVADDPDVWSAAYDGIETLSVAGISMLTASLEDFLLAVATGTDVDVALYLRRGTGPHILDQLATSYAPNPVNEDGDGDGDGDGDDRDGSAFDSEGSRSEHDDNRSEPSENRSGPFINRFEPGNVRYTPGRQGDE